MSSQNTPPTGQGTPQQLAQQLRNIGPVVAEQLLQAGIDTPAKLKQLGAEAAYLRMLAAGAGCGKPHALYLYALEGAIQDCDWRDIGEEKKTAYKTFVKLLKLEKAAS